MQVEHADEGLFQLVAEISLCLVWVSLVYGMSDDYYKDEAEISLWLVWFSLVYGMSYDYYKDETEVI